MENTNHSKSESTLTVTPRRIKQFSIFGRCRGTRSRFDSSRRFC